MARTGRFDMPAVALLIVAALGATLALVGCKGLPAPAQLHPTVKPPAIRQAGTLRAGVDLSTPPFGGTDAGRRAGIDVDVAAALAARLGLKLTIVDVKPSDAATALAGGTADVVLSVPYSADALANSTLAGSYIADGPAFFVAAPATTSVVPTISVDTLTAAHVGAQQGSLSYWELVSALGTEPVTPYPTLRDALTALQAGAVQAVGGDAIVGAYIARDMPTVRFAGQIEPAVPVGIAVATDNTTLEDAVRVALDGMAGDGILDAVRTKWVGSLPKLDVPTSSDETSSSVPTTTP